MRSNIPPVPQRRTEYCINLLFSTECSWIVLDLCCLCVHREGEASFKWDLIGEAHLQESFMGLVHSLTGLL
jgi:hypothetical protein